MPGEIPRLTGSGWLPGGGNDRPLFVLQMCRLSARYCGWSCSAGGFGSTTAGLGAGGVGFFFTPSETSITDWAGFWVGSAFFGAVPVAVVPSVAATPCGFGVTVFGFGLVASPG